MFKHFDCILIWTKWTASQIFVKKSTNRTELSNCFANFCYFLDVQRLNRIASWVSGVLWEICYDLIDWCHTGWGHHWRHTTVARCNSMWLYVHHRNQIWKNKTFIWHARMICSLITNWTAVVVLFLCSLGLVFPRVTSRQHVYSLVEHSQRDSSFSLCPSYSRQTCHCSHALSDPAQIWGYAPSTCLKEKQFDSNIRSASAVT